MATTLRRTRYGGQSAPRPRIHPAYLSARADCSPQSLAAHLGTYVDRIAHLIDAAAAIPDPAFIDRVLAPIDAARSGVAAPPLTPELIHAAQTTDAAEEIAESHYRASPTLPALRAWILALEKQRGDSLLLLLALKGALANG